MIGIKGGKSLNKWLRKSFVVMVSVLTFGLITPQLDIFDGRVNADPSKGSEAFENVSSAIVDDKTRLESHSGQTDKQKFIEETMKMAEAQAYQKFGSKIKPVIENEFKDVILPNIQLALEDVSLQFPEEELTHLAITERPGSGVSEKIFHVVNSKTSEDIIRFHVRRDHPPQQGYWFNFHYHTIFDQYQKHHHLGSIYWDKNTPPKWMA